MYVLQSIIIWCWKRKIISEATAPKAHKSNFHSVFYFYIYYYFKWRDSSFFMEISFLSLSSELLSCTLYLACMLNLEQCNRDIKNTFYSFFLHFLDPNTLPSISLFLGMYILWTKLELLLGFVLCVM